MGLFSEFMQFFTSVLLGKKDASQSFLQPLTMGERYLRWGNERNDMRDYRGALTQLDLCNDEDAPKPDMLVRKYTAILGATVGAVELMIRNHKEHIETLGQSAEHLAEELKSTEAGIKKAQERVNTLTEEGSLIKAKEEERHVEDLKMSANQMRRTMESGDNYESMLASYEHMAQEAETLCQRLEKSLVTMESLESIPPESTSQLRNQIITKLEEVRNQINEQKPSPPDETPEAETDGTSEESEEAPAGDNTSET